MSPRGVAYGFAIHSAFALPELCEGQGDEALSLVHQVVTSAPLIPLGLSRVGDQLRYGHREQAWVVAGQEVRVLTLADGPPQVVRLLGLGVGVALALHARGLPVLHATTVRIGGVDVALCGGRGVGKSTTTAALLAAGGQLVADDLAVLDRDGVRLGIPRVKLWGDTARHFGLGPEGLQRVHPDFDKYSVPVPLAAGRAPLAAIVWLERGAPGLTRLRGGDALRTVLANHRTPDVLSPAESARWMAQVGELLRADLPVLRLGLPGPLDQVERAARTLWREVTGAV